MGNKDYGVFVMSFRHTRRCGFGRPHGFEPWSLRVKWCSAGSGVCKSASSTVGFDKSAEEIAELEQVLIFEGVSKGEYDVK